MRRIKACPFCGGTVRIRFSGYYQRVVIEHMHARDLCVFDHIVTHFNGGEEALRIWNTRCGADTNREYVYGEDEE